MNSHADEQRRRNLQRRDSWDQFAAHRQQTTRLLVKSAMAGQRLCVLGAGNCNDLNLIELRQYFDPIQLVDLDGDALEAGIQRQGLAASDHLVPHVQDLTGLFGRIQSLGPAELLGELDEVPRVSNAEFDVVASICTLSQLIEVVFNALGAENQMLSEVILALRRQHLRLIVSMLRPGGLGLLISDFVSSDTCPEIRDVSVDKLPAAAGRWISERNFFTGANPFALKQFLQREMNHAVEPTSVVLHKPWKWDLGPRIYAVAAIQFRRTASEPKAGANQK